MDDQPQNTKEAKEPKKENDKNEIEEEEEEEELKQLLTEYLNKDAVQIMKSMGFAHPVIQRVLLSANNDVDTALDYVNKYENMKNPITLAEAAEIIANRDNSSEYATSDEEDNTDNLSNVSDYKMVIVVREDLQMGVGKIAAQCSHAAVHAYQKCSFQPEHQLQLIQWQETGSKKVVVKISSESELKQLQRKADELGIITSVIYDAGRTEVNPHTLTCMAVGPARASDVDRVTGKLQLL